MKERENQLQPTNEVWKKIPLPERKFCFKFSKNYRSFKKLQSGTKVVDTLV